MHLEALPEFREERFAKGKGLKKYFSELFDFS
jgi:hypothetical protein